MKEVKKPSVQPLYGGGAVFCICCLVLPVYRLWGLIVSAALAIKTWRALQKVFPPQTVLVAVPEPEPDTGNPQLDEILRNGQAALLEMRQLNTAIDDQKLSAQIDTLEALARKIFAQITEQPEKLSQIRKFMNYYLPTTIRLLKSYDRLENQGIHGQNIDDSLAAIRGMMDKIVVAFQAQLDHLFAFDAMDITAEIAVMEQMLAAEGLTAEQL